MIARFADEGGEETLLVLATGHGTSCRPERDIQRSGLMPERGRDNRWHENGGKRTPRPSEMFEGYGGSAGPLIYNFGTILRVVTDEFDSRLNGTCYNSTEAA